jgi:FkbM family methyltransferase
MISMHRVGKALGVASAVVSGIGNGMRNKPAVLVDIGGRGGLGRSWYPLWRAGLVKPVFFEPDPDAASQILARHPSAVVIGKGVWSQEGRETLHLTAQPGCSSVLMPMPDPRMPEALRNMMAVERMISVDLVRAEDELGRLELAPEIVKVDVQGGELEVLKGFGSMLHSVYCCELEVSFLRGYRDQPLFDQVFEFMTDAGFGLFDLKVFGVAATRNGVQANAFFCRRDAGSSRQRSVEALFRHASDFMYWS